MLVRLVADAADVEDDTVLRVHLRPVRELSVRDPARSGLERITTIVREQLEEQLEREEKLTSSSLIPSQEVAKAEKGDSANEVIAPVEKERTRESATPRHTITIERVIGGAEEQRDREKLARETRLSLCKEKMNLKAY